MKKIFILCSICCLILTGCANEANYSGEKERIESTYSNSGEILSEEQENNEQEPEFIGAFEKAEYNKYNSYASENGLGNTLIYVEGIILNKTIIGDNMMEFTLEQTDGNRWTIGMPINSEDEKNIEGIIEQNVRAFGTYTGYSDVFNLPAMVLVVEDFENMDKARIEIEENGEYVTVWRFSDFAEEEIKKQEENKETDESSVEEQSQESIDVYVPTTGERNALGAAKDYLELMAFSYQGLVEQLEYEKYSHDEAVYAADNCGADWNEQAAKAAKGYLKIMSFSKDKLIEQLEYGGFTHEQAVYGVEANGY